MKPLYILGLAAFLPLVAASGASVAQEVASLDPLPLVQPYGPRDAAGVGFAEQLYLQRPVVVFADSPADPNFIRQMELLARDLPALELRDVVLVTDTDPGAKTEWRMKLRPRGFSLVLMDKDLKPVIRKPLPWEVREIVAAIDKFPLRRQEVLERNPAGR
ncbi:MAG: DUF4174 domain-containing protein [Rhodobacteraceae bacterium]|nr:DUF4174 domain-containing protein [Paracoccaceae bacterium]